MEVIGAEGIYIYLQSYLTKFKNSNTFIRMQTIFTKEAEDFNFARYILRRRYKELNGIFTTLQTIVQTYVGIIFHRTRSLSYPNYCFSKTKNISLTFISLMIYTAERGIIITEGILD